ncbi:hypothetical protein P4B35_04265 [Pontiellaceae bacterium B12227]|nr:hypothetical protein [Pontiellaceae bacterium B12227]
MLGLAGFGLAASIVLTLLTAGKVGASDSTGILQPVPAEPLDIQALEHISRLAVAPVQSEPASEGLLVSPLRVVAIGSAYPIPYEAEVCPFSDVPQPAMNQLDRDGDEITDDWELKYGLNKYNASDALLDPDGDGFSNLEEFKAASEPDDAASHPPYAGKLRFVDRKDIPFFLVFKGLIENQDGSIVFQLNNPETGKSHFASLGESVEGVDIKRFEAAEEGLPPRLYVVRGSAEIELERGEIALDPESKAELINVLDQSPIMVTMGALLSLHNDEYTVLGVFPDKVILKDMRTGKVFDIVGLADGER